MEEHHIHHGGRYFEPVSFELTTSMTSSGWWLWNMKFHAEPAEDGSPRVLGISPVYSFINDHIEQLKKFVSDLRNEHLMAIEWDLFSDGSKVLQCWPDGDLMKIWVSFRNDDYEYGIETDRQTFTEAVIREYERFEVSGGWNMPCGTAFEPAPSAEFIPATIRITSDLPDCGSWSIRLDIQEASGQRRTIREEIFCSEVWDPVPQLRRFLAGLREGGKNYDCFDVDEEGTYVLLKYWPCGEQYINVHFYSKGRKGNPDFEYHLRMDRLELTEQFQHALDRFDSSGGWYEEEPDEYGIYTWRCRKERHGKFL